MDRVYAVVLALFGVVSLVGCGGSDNKVSTQNELQTFAEQHGDTTLDPNASTPLEK
jgi:hypothetical protein